MVQGLHCTRAALNEGRRNRFRNIIRTIRKLRCTKILYTKDYLFHFSPFDFYLQTSGNLCLHCQILPKTWNKYYLFTEMCVSTSDQWRKRWCPTTTKNSLFWKWIPFSFNINLWPHVPRYVAKQYIWCQDAALLIKLQFFVNIMKHIKGISKRLPLT